MLFREVTRENGSLYQNPAKLITSKREGRGDDQVWGRLSRVVDGGASPTPEGTDGMADNHLYTTCTLEFLEWNVVS